MSTSQNMIKQLRNRRTALRDAAANTLISISIKLEDMIIDRNIDSLEKFDLEEANDSIKRAIRRIKPLRSVEDLLGDSPS